MSESGLYSCFTPEEVVLLNQFVNLLLHENESGLSHKQLMERYIRRHGTTIKCSLYGVNKVTELYDKFQSILYYDGKRVHIDSAIKSDLQESVKSMQREHNNNNINKNNNNNVDNSKTKNTSMTSVGCQTVKETVATELRAKQKVTTTGCQTNQETVKTKMKSCQTEIITVPKSSTTSQSCQTDEIVNVQPSTIQTNEIATNTDQPMMNGPVDARAVNTSLLDVSLVDEDESTAADNDNNEFLYEIADRKEPEGQTRSSSSPARSCSQNLNGQSSDELTKMLSDLQENMMALRKEMTHDKTEKESVTARLSTLNDVLTRVETTCSTIKTHSVPTLLRTYKELSRNVNSQTKDLAALKTGVETKFSSDLQLTQRLGECFNRSDSTVKQLLGEHFDQYRRATATNMAEILAVLLPLAEKVKYFSDAMNVKDNFHRQSESVLLNELRSSLNSLRSQVEVSNHAVHGLQTDLQQEWSNTSGRIVERLDRIEANTAAAAAREASTTSVVNEVVEDFGPSIFVCRFCRRVPRQNVVIDVGCGGLIGCEACVTQNLKDDCPRCKRKENFEVLTNGWETILLMKGF